MPYAHLRRRTLVLAAGLLASCGRSTYFLASQPAYPPPKPDSACAHSTPCTDRAALVTSATVVAPPSRRPVTRSLPKPPATRPRCLAQVIHYQHLAAGQKLLLGSHQPTASVEYTTGPVPVTPAFDTSIILILLFYALLILAGFWLIVRSLTRLAISLIHQAKTKAKH